MTVVLPVSALLVIGMHRGNCGKFFVKGYALASDDYHIPLEAKRIL